jgi:hypothetical protein
VENYTRHQFTFYDYETPDNGFVKFVQEETPNSEDEFSPIRISAYNDRDEMCAMISMVDFKALLKTLPCYDRTRDKRGLNARFDMVGQKLRQLDWSKIPNRPQSIRSCIGYGFTTQVIENGSAIAELDSIKVFAVSMRRQGLGQEIIKLTTENIAKNGIKTFFGYMCPWADGDITPAKRKAFYLSLGFAFPPIEKQKHLGIEKPKDGNFVSPTNNKKIRNPLSVRDDYLTDRVNDILNG